MSRRDLKGKKVVIMGAGRSGLAAALGLVHLGAKPKISDNSRQLNLTEEFIHWAEQHQVPIECGGHTPKFIQEGDLLVVSPGVRWDAPPIQWARKKNIPVIGEMELASWFCRKPIIAVTGSSGKTTTVHLIHEVITKSGRKACLCGNLGSPFIQHVFNLQDMDYVVLEVSSFQLESIDTFKPFIAVFLNFHENHLDRHRDMLEYFEAKKRIFLNQTKKEFALLNAQDPRISPLSDQIPATVRFFNVPQTENGLPGRTPNHSAVIEVAKILGIPPATCEDVFAHFKGVEHRLEWVRTVQGVEFINDSKATTAEAGRWAMENIQKPILMICGGRDKNIDFNVLRDLVKRKVKKVFVLGEAREKIRRTFEPVVNVEECENLERAVHQARREASPGDCVLLSPMCASFDMFKNFEERGKIFKDIVNRLE